MRSQGIRQLCTYPMNINRIFLIYVYLNKIIGQKDWIEDRIHKTLGIVVIIIKYFISVKKQHKN